jgi:hypothetical protein
MHGLPHIVEHCNIAAAVKVDRIGICWGGVVCRREVAGGQVERLGGPGKDVGQVAISGE